MSKGYASNYRIVLLASLVFAAFGGLGARLVWLHVIGRGALLPFVLKARRDVIPDYACRGSIRDRNDELLATSRAVIVLGADPSDLRPGDEAKWPELARLAGIPLSELTRLLTTKFRPAEALPVASGPRTNLVFNLPASSPDDDAVVGEPDERGRRPIQWVKLSDEVTEQVYQQIQALRIRGVYGTTAYRRTYPHNELAAHLIGYVNKEQQPVTGLERYLNFYLKGENGWKESEKDGSVYQRELAQFRSRVVHPEDGYDVRLTIDTVVQEIAEDELRTIAQKWHPKKATVIVSDPRTGFILALANYPTFDLNTYNRLGKEGEAAMHNVAVDAEYEPGSVFKIVAVSAGLEQRLVTPASEFDCGITKTKALYKGMEIGLPREDVSDHFTRPLTVADIITHSSNKGTAQIALLLGEQRFYDYVRAFGFDELSGFPVGGEIIGDVPRPPGTPYGKARNWSMKTFTRMPIGQGVAVTALQMHRAMSVIASGGVLLRPQIIREIRTSNGDLVFRYGPSVERRVISAETARVMARLLWGPPNIPGGTAPLAAIPGFDVAGKTGTGNKPRTDGVPGYQDHHHVVSSFVGFLPADNPQVDISVIIDDADASRLPRQTAYGGTVAAPAFHDIAVKLIPYLDIRPSQPRMSPATLALEGGPR